MVEVKYPGGEWRQDTLTGRWMVVAPRRGERPMVMNGPGEVVPPEPEALERCPFCPGHEDQLPTILEETPGRGGDPWATRAVTNRYPAFVAVAPGSDEGPRRAVGFQEVLVETPEHALDWPDFDGEHARAVLELYLRSLERAYARPGHTPFLFRNRGRDSGSSQPHAHAQMVAVRGVPPEVRDREQVLRRHRAETGRCLVCSLPDVEPGHGDRVVWSGVHWEGFVPWAPADPFHLRLIPRRHVSSLVRLDDDERAELAEALVALLAALRSAAGDPHYNLLVHDHGLGDDGALHAHVELRTRFTRTAGFELMTGTEIAVSEPHLDAAVLREGLPPR